MARATISKAESPASGRLAPADRFGGYFGTGSRTDPAPNSLTDHRPARVWLDRLDAACGAEHYTFQAPLQGRAGPHVLVDGQRFLLLSSYDYLGLLGHPRVEAAAAAAIRRYGTGTGGVRLLTGTNVLHRDLEAALAEFKGTDSAIVFSSGYLTNLGAIASLFGPRDLVLLDARCHRSSVDGCRLGRVPFRLFRHNDPEHLDALLAAHPGRRALIVVEGIYSMDGDVCPLPEIVDVKRRHGAFLMVDEAHSLGVLGPTGRGVHDEFGVPSDAVDIWMGSLSKAIPSSGGYLTGRRDLIYYLQHGAAPFMYSAALCPAATAAALEAVAVLAAEPGRVRRVRRNAARLRDGLRALGYDTGASTTPVIPVIVGEIDDAFDLSRALWDRGVSASAIVAPAVPRHRSRLRLCATAAMDEADITEALTAFAALRSAPSPEVLE